MTLVRKVINGKSFYYFQEWKGGRIVTTYIGSVTKQKNFNVADNIEPFIKHLENLYKISDIFIDDDYHFEEYPPNPLILRTLKIAKSMFQLLKKNMPEISQIETELFVRYVHSTTALEGCTLDLAETKNLLSESMLTPYNKPFSDSQAVLNYKAVKEYIDNYHGEISERFILQLHRLVMNNLNEGPVGKYRETDGRGIPGVNHSKWQDIPKHIEDLIEWYHNKEESNLHPIELASRLHHKFEEIHPFHDGNGRVGRAILDFMLKNDGLPTIFIPIKQKYDYISALRAANETPRRDSNYLPMIEFVLDRITKTLIFIFVKSRLYEGMKSPQFKEFLIRVTSEDLYDTFIYILDTYYEKPEEDY